MMSILAILVVVVLNLVPGNVTTFNMQMNENVTIRFARQSDGGWNAVKLPKDDLGTFYVNGAKLTMKEERGEGKTHTQDLSTMLGVDKDTDWKKLKEVKFGAIPVQIERKENGLDFMLMEKGGASETKQTFKVRWDKADDRKFVTELKAQGLAQYLEHLVEDSKVLASLMGPDSKIKFLTEMSEIKEKKLNFLSASVIRPSKFLEIQLIVSGYESNSSLTGIAFNCRTESREPFSLSTADFPDVQGTIVKRYFQFLPVVNIEDSIIDSGKKALETMLAQKDFGAMSKFESSLAANATAIPNFVKSRIAGQTAASAARDNALFKAVEIDPKVTYIQSKAITEQIILSNYFVESSLAPGVLTIYWFIAEDKKPLVCGMSAAFGNDAFVFLSEMSKSKSSEVGK